MKHHINLYGAEFRPRRLWASLSQMSLVWGAVLLVMAAVTLAYGWQQRGVDARRPRRSSRRRQV
jgi:hypothetical protein